jgi:hypothetical protein
MSGKKQQTDTQGPRPVPAPKLPAASDIPRVYIEKGIGGGTKRG